MREIKFRVWDSGLKKMILFSPEYFLDDDRDTITFGTAERYYVAGDHDSGNRFKLMQYTGLKDKNGVDIYESDILEYRAKPNFDPNYPDRFRFSVQWGDKGFRDNRVGFDIYKYEDGEVIGNMYENPELMKDSD